MLFPRDMFNFKPVHHGFKFEVKHIPGKEHVTPDTFSRRQDSPIAHASTTKQDLDGNISNVMHGYSASLGPPSWISTPSVSAMMMDTNTAGISNVDELLTGLVLASIAGVNSYSNLSPLTSPTQPTVLCL